MSLRSFASRTYCTHAGGAIRYLLRSHQVGALSSFSSLGNDSMMMMMMTTTKTTTTTTTTTQRHYSVTYRKEEQEKEDPSALIPPSMDMAKSMATGLSQMDNTTLTTIAALGHHEAGCEVLRRHIMAVDNLSYADACVQYEEIAKTNRGTLNIETVPYLIGISLGMIGAFGALPMVFDLTTALWFNDAYVTTDIPEPRDLETKLEVGSWTWNWMEPPLGTFSFVLLCLQYARGQIQNLGLHPYTSMVRRRRAERLADRYPQYSSEVLKQFSYSDRLIG